MSEIKIVKMYPLHEIKGELNDVGKPGPSTYHQLLMLPEQIGLKATSVEDVQLFCVHCKALVVATMAQYRQAQEAAQAEGVGAIVIGPPVPGSLPEELRRALFYTRRLPHHLAAIERLKANPWKAPSDVINRLTGTIERLVSHARAAVLIGSLDGFRMGYFVRSAETPLTPAGEAMAALVADPDVPPMLPEDPTAFAHYVAGLLADDKKARRKKRAKAVVGMPMVCVCGHGPREHLDAAGADRCCKTCGVVCAGYRQAKPPKTEKRKATA